MRRSNAVPRQNRQNGGTTGSETSASAGLPTLQGGRSVAESSIGTNEGATVSPPTRGPDIPSVRRTTPRAWTGNKNDIDNVVTVVNNYITTKLFPLVKFIKKDDSLMIYDVASKKSLCRKVSAMGA